MKSSAIYAAVAAAVLSAAGPGYAQQAQPQVKIGIVDIDRIMRESTPAVRAQKNLEADMQKRDQEMRALMAQLKRLEDGLDRSRTSLSETEERGKRREFDALNREFERKRQQYSDELNQKRNDMLAQVLEQAHRVIRQVAEREDLDAVFQEAAVYNPRLDITDKVLKALETAPRTAAKPAAK